MQELTTALPDVTESPSNPTLNVNTPGLSRQHSAPPDLAPQVSPNDAHRVEDEVIPDDPFQNERFQDALKRSKELMVKLDGDLSRSSLVGEQDSVIRRLHDRVQDLAGFQCPATRTVGFVGDSGVGESSSHLIVDYQALTLDFVIQEKAVF